MVHGFKFRPQVPKSGVTYCARNLKPFVPLSYMAMDSSIYSSPGHVVPKVVQRCLFGRSVIILTNSHIANVLHISTVGDLHEISHLGTCGRNLKPLYHLRLYVVDELNIWAHHDMSSKNSSSFVLSLIVKCDISSVGSPVDGCVPL